MILGKVRIQNFKSIKDTGWVYLSQSDLVTILAGQNESGKTSFLRALRFFEEGDYTSFDDEDRRLDDHPRVDCVFFLKEKEYNDLRETTNKKIADYVMKNGIRFVRGDVEEDNFGMRRGYPDEFKQFVVEFNKSKDEGKTESTDENNNEGVEESFDAFKYFSDIRPEMIFYSSFSDSILPGKIKYSDIELNQAVQDFQTIYDVDFESLLDPEKTNDRKREREVKRIRDGAAESLNQYWNQEISGENVNYNFTISVHHQKPIQEGYVNFFINQGDEAQLKISQKSQGFQWFVGFNLRLKSHEKQLEEKGLILLIDEPGQGLHEVAQNDVKNILEELAQNSNIQIIYSTHQPTLLGESNIDFSRLLLVDRTNDDGSKFKTIAQLVSSKGSLDSLAPVRTALGMISLVDPFKKSKLSLIVEGITEFYYLKTVLDDKYTVIPSTGVDQVPNIFAIMYGWGVATKVLVDNDTQGRKAYKRIKLSFFEQDDRLLNKTVLKPERMDGIEATLSAKVIETVMSYFDKEYNKNLSKTENVKLIGKSIFAKKFSDLYSGKTNTLDKETLSNFKEISDFLKL